VRDQYALQLKRVLINQMINEACGGAITIQQESFMWHLYTVKKVTDFPVPSRDATNQTLPGGE
jgi:hypothetical protein